MTLKQQLTNQVTNLELSKKLKELGAKQDSYFSYYWLSEKEHLSDKWSKPKVVVCSELEINDDDSWRERYEEICSAFTFDELLDLLPREIKKKQTAYWLCIEPANLLEGSPSESKGFAVGYRNNKEWMRPFFEELSRADASAQCWLYLRENNLVE